MHYFVPHDALNSLACAAPLSENSGGSGDGMHTQGGSGDGVH